MAHRKSARRVIKARRAAQCQQLAASNTPSPAGLPWPVLGQLEARIVGRVVLPGDPDYNQARQESNPAFQAYPQVIVYCAVQDDVLACLAIARQFNLWVALRSGGHSTAGYSVNDGMVIDLSQLRGVVLDEANALVHVLPGTDFDTFNGAMKGTGWHVPTGACGSVCVAGFVQGGGYGYTSRNFGIQSDCVASFRVALADGSVVNASATENPDLFWAMRGGTGGNFGVLLQVSYRMVRLAQVWAFAVSWAQPYAAQVLQLMQAQYMKTGAPDALGYMMNLGYVGGQPVYMVQGMFCGTREDGLAAIAPLLELPSAQLLVDQVGDYPSMDQYLEDHPYSLPDNLPDGACETKASGYIAAPLSLAQWQAIVDYFGTSPNGWSLAYLEPYGGAINRYPVQDSAFVHRDADTNLVVDVFWTNESERQQMEAWLAGFMQLLRPMMNGHVYQNYPDASLADFRQAYWGGAYDTLVTVKQRVDPTNFFRFQQSIGQGGDQGAA
jgi:FAD/FMN-containing dehydrogenase